jgi:hypothetical protein
MIEKCREKFRHFNRSKVAEHVSMPVEIRETDKGGAGRVIFETRTSLFEDFAWAPTDNLAGEQGMRGRCFHPLWSNVSRSSYHRTEEQYESRGVEACEKAICRNASQREGYTGNLGSRQL